MKRASVLADIRHCGYNNDTEKAALITAQKGIGKAASRKAFLEGRKTAGRGDPCDCQKCAGKKGKE